jgi:hypothetical protein
LVEAFASGVVHEHYEHRTLVVVVHRGCVGRLLRALLTQYNVGLTYKSSVAPWCKVRSAVQTDSYVCR